MKNHYVFAEISQRDDTVGENYDIIFSPCTFSKGIPRGS